MIMLGERDVLLQLLETAAKDWEENYRPEDIRLSAEKLNVFLNVEKLVQNSGEDLSADVLRQRCPTFVDLYQQVLLRDL